MFFRVKKIKGKEYAYIVENDWQSRGPRQKVKGYAGRVYRFIVGNNVNFSEYIKIENIQNYIEKNPKNRIIQDLVEWELFRFGINKEEFLIDLNEIKLQRHRRNVVLLLNDGFMCNSTLKDLLYFKPEGDEQTDGYRLAKAFVDAGIKVPQEVFIGIFGKLYKSKFI
ncbi:MAG: hypothetical protein AABX33_00940 [Nanoarchaeota archaeon]